MRATIRLSRALLLSFGLTLILCGVQAMAQEQPADAPVHAPEPAAGTVESLGADIKARSVETDTVWVLVTAFLVFWMQAGFAFVETGLTRAKNTVNILMKNMMDFCFATVGFWFVGFGVMCGAGSDWFGTSGFLLHDIGNTFDSLSWTPVDLDTKFFFQLVFAGTGATLVSGATAARTRFSCYLIY